MIGSIAHGRSTDVLDVKGKAVVFFGPTEREYSSLTENEKNEWSEVLSDFYHYRDKTVPFFESNKIKPFVAANTKIIIHNWRNARTFARKNFKHIVGYILTDGNKKPIVVEGAGADLYLINDFKEYFELK